MNNRVKKMPRYYLGGTKILTAPTGGAWGHTAPESVKRAKSIEQILVKNKMEG